MGEFTYNSLNDPLNHEVYTSPEIMDKNTFTLFTTIIRSRWFQDSQFSA